MKKRKKPSFIDKVYRLKAAGLFDSPSPNRLDRREDKSAVLSLESRISQILGIINADKRPQNNMLFFIMYDISSNKVRRLVSNYLEDKGCTRVQNSIFLADLNNITYECIKRDLTAVQEAYENKDSIMIVPVSTDTINSMKVIGKSINVDLICHKKHTLIF